MTTTRLYGAIVAMALASFPLRSSADSIISSGQIVGTAYDYYWSFRYGGATYTGGNDVASLSDSNPAVVGQPFGISVPLFDGIDTGGSYTASGVTTDVAYGDLLVGYNSALSLSASIPDITGAGSFSGGFTFGGSLCVYPLSEFPLEPAAPCLNTGGRPVQISGSGTVVVTAVADPNYPEIVEVTNAVFTFSTVPESSGMALFAAGLFGLGWSQRRRFRRAA